MDGLARIGRRRLLGTAAALIGAAAMPWRVGASAAAAAGAEHLAVSLGDLGPRLIAAGAIDPARFIAACAAAGSPLGAGHRELLLRGGDAAELHASSAHFLLNFFWAAGLANHNRLLTHGPMLANGMSRISGYASTGGWSLGTRPAMELYARFPLMPLGAMQQARLEEVAAQVHRPCCDNPTSFPDCNHGMAMLGLLTRLAADGRDADALFEAARIANAHWYPRQARQLEAYLRAAMGPRQARLGAREASSRQLFSASGFRKVAAWAADRGLAAPVDPPRC